MSGARATIVQLSAEQLAAIQDEQRRARLSSEVDAITQQRAELARRCGYFAEAFEVAPLQVAPTAEVDRSSIERMSRFVTEEAAHTRRLEQQLYEQVKTTRRTAALHSMQTVATAAAEASRQAAPRRGDVSAELTTHHVAQDARGDDSVPDRLQIDLAQAADVMCRLDDRIPAPEWTDGLMHDLAATGPERRRMLLLHLESEVEALNASRRRNEAVRRELEQLAARSAELEARGLARRVSRAQSDHEAGRPVQLEPLRVGLDAAEVAFERRRSREYVEELVVAAFRRRGYDVLTSVGVYAPQGGLVLQRDHSSPYGVAVSVGDDGLRVSTVLFSEPSSGAARQLPGTAQQRRTTCDDALAVVGDLPATGLIVGRSLEVSTEDHVLEVQEGFLGRRPAPSVDQARSAPPRHLELGL